MVTIGSRRGNLLSRLAVIFISANAILVLLFVFQTLFPDSIFSDWKFAKDLLILNLALLGSLGFSLRPEYCQLHPQPVCGQYQKDIPLVFKVICVNLGRQIAFAYQLSPPSFREIKDDQAEKHGCQAYTVDREPHKQISKIVSDLDLSNV